MGQPGDFRCKIKELFEKMLNYPLGLVVIYSTSSDDVDCKIKIAEI